MVPSFSMTRLEDLDVYDEGFSFSVSRFERAGLFFSVWDHFTPSPSLLGLEDFWFALFFQIPEIFLRTPSGDLFPQ